MEETAETLLEDDRAGATPGKTTEKSEDDASISIPQPLSTQSSTSVARSKRWRGTRAILAGPSAGVYTLQRKRVILAVVSITGVLGPLMGTIFSPALPDVERDLSTTDVLANLALTLSQVGMALSPLFWAPLSEKIGRRPVLLISQMVNIGGSVMAVLSPTIEVFLVARLVSAIGSGAGLVVGAAVVSDVFPTEERGRAMGVFMMGPLLGPAIAPPIGGVLARFLGWRHIFTTTGVLACLILLSTLFWLPETNRDILEGRTSSAATSGGPPKPSAIKNLWTAITYQRKIFVCGPTILQGAVFGSYYAFPGSLPRDWQNIYSFNTAQVGLVVATIGIGMVAGSLFGGWHADRQVRIWTQKRKVWVPEDRLRSQFLGAVTVPVGLLLYGFGIQYRIPWGILIISLVLVGYGNMVISTCSSAYYMDTFGRSFASINGVATCLRLIFSAVVAVVVVPGIAGMSHAGFFGLLAGICVLTGTIVLAIVARGTEWRCAEEPWKSQPQSQAQLEAWRATKKGIFG
ncbi:MFS general substrate transporter [Gonapodya prolifera JEL478]|uniref:MFS general substrate transporter n=1 Tax=Gonapodya prolifera (strain JEL478) TaxID=1344416 RepID=A0A139A822_GONPJ|nr:MFS general substrate transporter [Gonapodya prolifera JEL478]|eukprot:KXS12877.1 MFS general substrate transporter [Gonapodya prolifera JEL478]